MRLRLLSFSGVLSVCGMALGGCATGTPDVTPAGGSGGEGGVMVVDPECDEQPDGTACGNAMASVCDEADTCVAGICVENIALEGKACGDVADTECNPADTCNAIGECIERIAVLGKACGDGATTECTEPDFCDGQGECQNNHRDMGYGCGDPVATECSDVDICDGDGICLANDLAVDAPCGDSTVTQCSGADACDGMGVCEVNDEASGIACGDQAVSDCSAADTCDGSGLCLDNHALLGVACGSVLNTDCNNPDSCDGGGVCLANFEMNGTACNDCTQGPGLCAGCGLGTCQDDCLPGIGSLQTTFASNNGLSGNMFDIVAKTNPVEIKSFEANLATGTHNVSVWYIAGGYAGHETTMGDWTFIATATGVVSAGQDLPTAVPVTVDVTIPAGQTYGFVVTSSGSNRYTDGTTEGAVYVQNTDLQILEGMGVQTDPFGGFQIGPRIFNGIVNYESPCP